MTSNFQQQTSIDLDFDLDVGILQAQIEEESIMPAESILSIFTTRTGTSRDDGSTFVNNVWNMEWKRLDRESDMVYRSGHRIPDKDATQTARARQTYSKQIMAFDKIGIKGRKPEDFLGLRCWIKETIENPNSQYEKIWWQPMAVYVEGQSKEEAMGLAVIESATNINPPAGTKNGVAPAEAAEEVLDTIDTSEGSDYDVFLSIVHGKKHRAAVTAAKAVDQLMANNDIANGVNNGNIFDDMMEAGLLVEGADGSYERVTQSA